MKKLIATFSFVLGVVALSFGQNPSNTAMTEGADALEKSKSTGTYVYTLPEGTTDAEVTKAASYYPDFFTVSFDESTLEATVEITGETKQSSQIMMRFLSGCGVSYVNVEGQEYQLHGFYQNHIE